MKGEEEEGREEEGGREGEEGGRRRGEGWKNTVIFSSVVLKRNSFAFLVQ